MFGVKLWPESQRRRAGWRNINPVVCQSQIKWTLNTELVPKHQKPHDRASAWPQGKGEFHVFTCLHATRLREADRFILATARQPRHACFINQTALCCGMKTSGKKKKNTQVVLMSCWLWSVVLLIQSHSVISVIMDNNLMSLYYNGHMSEFTG